MKNSVMVGIVISYFVFFSSISGFAAVDDQQIDISNPEFSRMDKDQDGLISCTEMQVSQPGLFTEADFGVMDSNNDGRVSKAEYTTYYNTSH